jgi:hypothetical protein
MTENKTRAHAGDVTVFLEGIEDPVRRSDCWRLTGMMQRITGSPPVMWGDSIVGFGTYHYRYASGREGDWFLAGFSPRKQNLTVYVMGYLDQYRDILNELGKHKHGKGCLYINKLEDIDLGVLERLLSYSIRQLNRSKPSRI